MKLTHHVVGALCALTLLAPANASAFCGFYVSGADEKMFNDATMVVMMREGTKTVLSMRNTYEGPAESFAMVVPVPVVLEKDNVKTLGEELFTKVDTLAAPRLVEYWEQDPCQPLNSYGLLGMIGSGRGGGGLALGASGLKNKDLGVKIEAQFEVGEYDIAILSAKESSGLETYLKQEKYNIPDGAAPTLAPYIEQGMYFFVAKVDPKKVTFKDGRALLSPLRFHYDSKDFSLPVRLGLINAKGPQDLIVHILARGQRYEAANRPNVTIPTNLIVDQSTRDRYGEFYATLFDRVTEETPGAVVTEYSWDASTCDPCPGPTLTPADLGLLGSDVVGLPSNPNQLGFGMGSWTLTRLHTRYTSADMTEDLIFRKAEPIVGGRGMPVGSGALLDSGVMGEQRAIPSTINNFQGRYIMLNPWEGKVACTNPVRGRWGGPVGGANKATKTAQQNPLVERGKVSLEEVVKTTGVLPTKIANALKTPAEDAGAKPPAANGSGDPKASGAPTTNASNEPKGSGCATAGGLAPVGAAPLLVFALGGLVGWRRRRRPI